MRIVKSSFAVGVLGLLVLGSARADGLQQPASVNFAAYGYNYPDPAYSLYPDFAVGNETEESVAEESETEQAEDAISTDLLSDGVCESMCGEMADCGDTSGRGGIFDRWLAADPWLMPRPGSLQRLGIDNGGFLQAGITLNTDSPADDFNGPLLPNDRSGEFQMNKLWLYFERPVDTGGYGFDVGGRVDLFYGTDYRTTANHGLGLDDRINRSDLLYGLSIPQMYAEVAWNDLSVRMGRMAGLLGYESVPPMDNFFYSHSYAMQYAEPVLITGLMGKYAISDRMAMFAGFHQGVHRFEDDNGRLNYQSGVMWTAPGGRTSVAYAFDIGRNDLAAVEDEFIHSLVIQHRVTSRLLYVIQNDLVRRDNVAALAGQDAETYGIVQYLLYTLNPCWAVGMRYEWFRDDDGTAVVGLNNVPGARGWTGAPGYAGNFNALTMGLNWTPKTNLTVRPEVRWDWYDGRPNSAGPNPLPFNNGTSTDQFTLAVDVILTF